MTNLLQLNLEALFDCEIDPTGREVPAVPVTGCRQRVAVVAGILRSGEVESGPVVIQMRPFLFGVHLREFNQRVEFLPVQLDADPFDCPGRNDITHCRPPSPSELSSPCSARPDDHKDGRRMRSILRPYL